MCITFISFHNDTLLYSGNLTRSQSHPSLRMLNHMTTERIVLLGNSGSCASATEYKNVDIFTPEEADIEKAWEVCNCMNTTHGYFFIEAIAMKGEIYVFSGDDSKSAGTVEKFDYLSNQWSTCPSIPSKNMFISSAAINDSVIVSGGLSQQTGAFSSSMYIMEMDDTKDGGITWKNAGMLPAGRYGHASIFYEGKLWILGGQLEGEQQQSNSCLLYDPLSCQCVDGPPSKMCRVWLKMFIINKQLYAVGGDNISPKSCPSIEVYDNKKECWKIVTFFPAPRKLYSSAVSGAKIYVFGGKDVHYCNVNTFDVYDVATDTWSCAIDGNLERQTIHNKEYFHGGQAVSISYA